jgi:hypothetical protein
MHSIRPDSGKRTWEVMRNQPTPLIDLYTNIFNNVTSLDQLRNEPFHHFRSLNKEKWIIQ